MAAQSQFYSQMKSEEEIKIEETKLDSMLELVHSIENVAKLASDKKKMIQKQKEVNRKIQETQASVLKPVDEAEVQRLLA